LLRKDSGSMATIGKIRKRSGLLLIAIGGAMGAFILGDFFSGGGGGQEQLVVGEINGKEVKSRDFEYRVEELAQAQKSVGATLDDNSRNQLREQVWNNLVREQTIEKEFDKLGLAVSKEEYDDVRFGNNILDFILSNQQFQNPETGQFDPNNVRQFFAVIQEQYPLYWKVQRDNVIKSRIQEKYFNLISKGVYVNSLQAKQNYVAQNRKINFDYVIKRYNSVPDSTISFTEAELKDYFNEHKGEAKFKQIESRSIDYVVFEKKASEADIEEITTDLERLKEDFQTAESDSAFVVDNSDVPFYRPFVYEEGSLENPTDSILVNSTVGTVVGPYKQNQELKISKVVVNGKVPEVNARHILLKQEGNESIEAVEKRADSLIQVIKTGGDFEALASTLSADQGSAANGGNLDWFGKGQMVPPFEKASFDAKKGEITKATSQFGVHVIEVLDRREVEQIQLASISRPLKASTRTVEKIYNTASEFSINYDNDKRFYEGVESEGLVTKSADDIAPGARFIPGLGANANKVARWMLGAELGDVSEPLELDDKFVVALLTEISEKGEPKLSQVRDEMERDLIREKKAEKLKAEMAGSDLNAIASKIDAQVQTATGVTFSTVNIPGAGREPKIVGQAFTLPEGAVSVPLKGEMGVYVVKVTSLSEAPETNSYASNRNIIKSQIENRAQNSAFQALMEEADINDERYKYYY
ncbi:MAG: peptidylprolyl isomerase, partial [Luteibaculum sp.]